MHQFHSVLFLNNGIEIGLLIKLSLELWNTAEQKVKVPQLYCDSRVQTVSADVMNFPRDRIRVFSPQVLFSPNEDIT